MATITHRVYNLQWRLLALQEALKDLATEIERLAAEVAAQTEHKGGKDGLH